MSVFGVCLYMSVLLCMSMGMNVDACMCDKGPMWVKEGKMEHISIYHPGLSYVSCSVMSDSLPPHGL